MEVFQETLTYYGTLQQEGKIESFEPVLIAPHGGGLAGFILLRGSRGSLDEVRFEPTSSGGWSPVRLRFVNDIGVIDAYTGEALGQQMALFQSVSEELGD